MKKVNRILAVSLVVLAVSFVSACSAKLDKGKLAAPTAPCQGEVAVTKKAVNITKNIGWGSLTVFAIPVARVTVEGEPSEELMRVVKETVEHMGYNTTEVNSCADSTGAPVLGVKVNKIFFYNYTWFVPLVFNWGNIDMTVSVSSPDGKVLWSKQYKGKGAGWYNFNPTVNKALNQVLNQMVADMSGPEFQKAVWGQAAESAPSSTGSGGPSS